MHSELDDQLSRSSQEYLATALRRRRWILLPLFICWAVVWEISWFLPVRYRSEALILVEQQKVPDQYVVPNVSMNLQDRLQSIQQQILSRTRLQATIDRMRLYSPQRGLSRLLKPGDPVDQMRNDIKIELVASPGHPGEFAAFKIEYSAGSPELAQRVNSELTSLFVNENVEAQRQLSENTTTFLENQLADARAKMEEQETKVAAFKAKHIGDLPGQMESNVQILTGLQAQLQNTQHALDAAKQQKLYLQSLLQEYQSAQTGVAGDSPATSTQTFDKELTALHLRLEDLRTHYTDDHPDVIAVKDSIAKTEKLKAAEEIGLNQRAVNATHPANPSAVPESQRGLPTAATMQVQSQLKANELEIQDDQQRENELEARIVAYQARLNTTPETEQGLTEISRGYEESKANYNSLLQKQMQSQLASSLERDQQGGQFRIIDPPSLPSKPSAPNHFLISMGGLIAGAILALGLVTLLELTDVRIREEKDIAGLVPAAVLVGIPRLSTPNEDQSRLITRRIELCATVVMAVVIAFGNLYSFVRG